ncbi:Acg family FMN-binding oxidoreductase [Actinomycetota bacterium Odt1-20B]
MDATQTHDFRSAGPHHAANYLVRAAVLAPSLHNSQPWLFTGDATGLDLYADPTRRLTLSDPDARELFISCGAALFNVRLAMRHLGFVPVVRLLPHASNPAHLAHVDWGPHEVASEATELMHRSLRVRHTHRGPFSASPLPPPLIDELRRQAHAEGADLRVVESGRQRARIAELVREAETIHRRDPGRRTELLQWSQEFHGSRLDGVPLATCTYHPDCVTLAGRDFLGLTFTLPAPPEVWRSRTGLVAVLTTRRDTRTEWLQAGQALQRVLLHATAYGSAAAFHTQPLELPRLRSEVRAALWFGPFPQMILRLGHAPHGAPTPRRPVADVLRARSGREPHVSLARRADKPAITNGLARGEG